MSEITGGVDELAISAIIEAKWYSNLKENFCSIIRNANEYSWFHSDAVD